MYYFLDLIINIWYNMGYFSSFANNVNYYIAGAASGISSASSSVMKAFTPTFNSSTYADCMKDDVKNIGTDTKNVIVSGAKTSYDVVNVGLTLYTAEQIFEKLAGKLIAAGALDSVLHKITPSYFSKPFNYSDMAFHAAYNAVTNNPFKALLSVVSGICLNERQKFYDLYNDSAAFISNNLGLVKDTALFSKHLVQYLAAKGYEFTQETVQLDSAETGKTVDELLNEFEIMDMPGKIVNAVGEIVEMPGEIGGLLESIASA